MRFRYIFPSVPCILVLVTVFVHSGCNLFKTRTPAEPDQTSSDYVPPNVPSIVFSNMVNSFKDKNYVNYLQAFADISTAGVSFSFEPTTDAQSHYTGIFLDWSKDAEQKYFRNMCTNLVANTTPTLEWLSLTEQSFSTDSVQYEATYRLTFSSTLPSRQIVATGRAQFFMKTNRDQNWVIRRWVDLANVQNEFTWSDVKGTFAQ